MKSNIYILLLILFFYAKVNAQIPIVRANSKMIKIKAGEKIFEKGYWTPYTELNPNIFTTFTKKKKIVTFYTDIDTISFKVKPKGVYDFIILLNEKDTCYTQIRTKSKEHSFQFSKRYKKEHKGNFSFEIPEFQELFLIVVALTPTGINDLNLVNHEGEYYHKVMNHFGKYKNEPIIKQIDTLIKENYAQSKMDACGFYFKGNRIKKEKTYDYLSWNGGNYIEPYIEEFKKFAIKTKFRIFYADNIPYYNNLISLMKNQSPVQKQWNWLEKNFSNSYDNYRITFSQLVGGVHTTKGFEADNFKQTIMFVSGPIENPENQKIAEGIMTRVVFTEIDHNYVNPISDKYIEEIKSTFKEIEKWSSNKSYPNSFYVFNEYMTWSVFSLYALDNFDNETFKIVNERVEKHMSKRKFHNFRSFNQKIIELYQNKDKNQTIADLYPEILNWCANE
jgi:phage-related protein